MSYWRAEPCRCVADFPVGPARRLENQRYGFGDALRQLWETILVWLTPSPVWRRYRVAPRVNPAAFRDELLRGIQRELHRAGLSDSRQAADRATV